MILVLRLKVKIYSMLKFVRDYLNSPPIIVYRVGNQFHKIGLIKIAFAISIINRLIFSTWIPSSSKIGKRFQAGYWGLGIVIHSDTVIGDDCLISQNVTIGKKNADDKHPPILNNNIYIGVGCVLIGEITIGNNVKIGANSFVNKSIPDDSIVAGSPLRVINYKNND